jgi:hypothetical protein
MGNASTSLEGPVVYCIPDSRAKIREDGAVAIDFVRALEEHITIPLPSDFDGERLRVVIGGKAYFVVVPPAVSPRPSTLRIALPSAGVIGNELHVVDGAATSSVVGSSMMMNTIDENDPGLPAVHCTVDFAVADAVVVALPRTLCEGGEIIVSVGGRMFKTSVASRTVAGTRCRLHFGTPGASAPAAGAANRDDAPLSLTLSPLVLATPPASASASASASALVAPPPSPPKAAADTAKHVQFSPSVLVAPSAPPAEPRAGAGSSGSGGSAAVPAPAAATTPVRAAAESGRLKVQEEEERDAQVRLALAKGEPDAAVAVALQECFELEIGPTSSVVPGSVAAVQVRGSAGPWSCGRAAVVKVSWCVVVRGARCAVRGVQHVSVVRGAARGREADRQPDGLNVGSGGVEVVKC